MLDEADAVLLVGTRNNQNGTDSWRLIPPAAKIIHIDIDPNEIGRNYEAVRLIGDAQTTLDALARALAGRDLSRRLRERGAREQRIASAWQRYDSDRRPLIHRNAGPIRPERVMAELQPLLTPETIVVADASYSSMWVMRSGKVVEAGAVETVFRSPTHPYTKALIEAVPHLPACSVERAT